MMWKAILTPGVILLLFPGPFCKAQIADHISDPRIELVDNNLLISYDIANSDPAIGFLVSLEVTDVDGNRIHARNLEGDIGENVTGGSNKQITWDLGADRIEMNEDIFVTLFAEPVQQVQNNNEGSIFTAEVTENSAAQSYHRTGIVMQSLVLPGLGLSRVTGKPHWIRGASAYGSIAGSIILNRMAIATYDDFKKSSMPEEASAFLSKSSTQDRFSEILAFAAIGIWASDIIWTLAGTSDLHKDRPSSHQPGISVMPQFNTINHSPMIVFCYRF